LSKIEIYARTSMVVGMGHGGEPQLAPSGF